MPLCMKHCSSQNTASPTCSEAPQILQTCSKELGGTCVLQPEVLLRMCGLS